MAQTGEGTCLPSQISEAATWDVKAPWVLPPLGIFPQRIVGIKGLTGPPG